MASIDDVEISAVHRRLQESSEVLSALSAKLKVISSVEQVTNDRLLTLENASEAISKAADAMDRYVSEISEAVPAVLSSLTAAEKFLAQTDLSSLASSIDSFRLEILQSVSALEESFQTRLSAFVSDVETTRVVERKLENAKTLLSVRKLKKLDEINTSVAT